MREDKTMAIKNKTYRNFIIVMNKIIAKGYDEKTAEDLAHKVFDNYYADKGRGDRSVEWFIGQILTKEAHDIEQKYMTSSASSAPAADDIELEPINQIVQVFSVGGGYYVDITVTEDWLGNGLVRQAWLYHNSIGVKEMLFGYLIKDIDFDEFCEILKGNLYDGNCYIDGYRETYMDSFKVYEEWKERA